MRRCSGACLVEVVSSVYCTAFGFASSSHSAVVCGRLGSVKSIVTVIYCNEVSV
jgi:hypothetical protein